MNEYSTLPKLRQYLSLASQQTSDDELLEDFLRIASRDIDDYCKRKFYPTRRTDRFDLPDNVQLITFDEEDLLKVYGLSSYNGASEIDSGAYWPRQGDNWNDTPYDRIELNRNLGSTLNFSGTPQRAVHVDGVWGFNSDYSSAWEDTGATLASPTGSANASMILSGPSTGSDIFGNASRIQQQHLLKIGDEYVYVYSGGTETDDDKINVRRGVNGSSAISHGSGTSVARWIPEPDIEFCARELAAFEYMRSTTPRTGRVTTFLGAGGISIEEESAIPPSIRRRLNRLKKRRVWSI